MDNSKNRVGQAKCQYCGYTGTTGGIKIHLKRCIKKPDNIKKTESMEEVPQDPTGDYFGECNLVSSAPTDEVQPIEQYLKTVSTVDLVEKIRITKVEIECLEESLPSLENELFYRNNPECRPTK